MAIDKEPTTVYIGERRMDWQPIETCNTAAYEPVDLWVVHGAVPGMVSRPEPRRYAAAYKSGNGKYFISKEGGVIEGRRFYEDGDVCFDQDDRGPDATIVTHWMPLPAPPAPTQETPPHE